MTHQAQRPRPAGEPQTPHRRTRSSGSTRRRFSPPGHVRYVCAQVSIIANTSSAGNLQEVVVDENTTSRDSWEDEAASLIQDMAEECGLTATVSVSDGHPHGTAMAANWHRPRWTALMWNPDTVNLVEGSYRPFGAPDYWHGCTTARLDVGTREPILVASYHGDPFRPDFRYNEALRLKGTLRTTGGVLPAFCVGDFNSISAAEVDDGHRGVADVVRAVVPHQKCATLGRRTQGGAWSSACDATGARTLPLPRVWGIPKSRPTPLHP